MGVKIKTIKDDFYKMKKTANALNGRKINVGVLTGEHTWLAGIHEYGCRITVTDEMRGYLNSQGLHLKKSTKEIVIPERSFLRTGFDQNHLRILEEAESLIGLVLDGIITPDDLYDHIGNALTEAVKDYAEDLRSPANHPFTVQRKNSSNPLVGSGDMVDGINYEVE